MNPSDGDPAQRPRGPAGTGWRALLRWERHVPALAMPRFLQHRWVWLAMMALVTVPFFVKIPVVLRRHPAISPLGDQFHVVLMAIVALLLYWRGPLRGRLWFATLAAITAGALVEFVQPLFGRAALLKDFLLDIVGIGIIVGLILWKGHRRRSGLVLMSVLLLSVPAQLYYLPGVVAASYQSRRTFPMIADFESGLDHWIWDENFHSLLKFVNVPDGPNGPTGVLRATSGPPDHWPGVKVRRFSHDWSKFRTLEFDVRVVIASTDSVPMSLRLDDYLGTRDNQGARLGFFADRRWRTIRFDLTQAYLSDKSRPLDTSDMELILVYLPRPTAPVVYELDNFRLRN
ncbi:MAG: hypothetical protein IPG61_09895 [bacterium]|nr:hypothetical protein [bacterium]